MLSDEEFASLGYTFIWRIENFSYCLERRNQSIESPRFVINTSGGIQTAWYLQVYPRYDGQDDNIGFSVCKVGSFGWNCIRLDYELSILAENGSLQESIECEECYFHMGHTYGETKWIAPETFRQKKNLYIPQNTLTLYCCMWQSGRLPQWLGQSSARTRIGTEKTSIIWPITAFNQLKLNENKTLIVPSVKKRELSLKFCLEHGMHFDTNIRIEILQSNIDQKNWIKCKISVVDAKGKLAYSTEDEHLFEESKENQIWNFPLFIRKSSLLKDKDLYLPNNTLHLQFDFTVFISVISSELEYSELGPYLSPHVNKFVRKISQISKPAIYSNSLKTDLNCLYAEKTLCDFNVIVGSETFFAHKAVLAARSSVFRTMISTDMLEKKSSQVIIPDVDSDTIKRMLLFMYTDTIEDLQWEHVAKLFSVADKYGIQSLKQECSYFLGSNICTENVAEALELGDMHQDSSLKKAAVEYIFRNDDKILLSDEWKKVMKRNGQLAAETMHSMYLKKSMNL